MGGKSRRKQKAAMQDMQNMASDQADHYSGLVGEQQIKLDEALTNYSEFEFTNPFGNLQNPYAGIQTDFTNPATGLTNVTDGYTNAAAGAINVAEGMTDWSSGMTNVAAGAQNVYAGARNAFAGLENQFAGMRNLYAGMENQYEGMENVFEDATVDTRAAQFQAQQTQQQQANIMQGLRGAAGSSGIAGLAQAMASQGQLATQQQAAGIGQQERQNQMLQMQEASKIQQLQRGEASRLATQEATGGMSIQQQERAGAAQLQQQAAAGEMQTQQMIMGGAAQQQQLQMQGAMQLQGIRGQAASQLQGLQFQGASQQQNLQMEGAMQLQGQQIAAAQQLQNQQLQGDMWAQEMGVNQQNLMASGQWEADVLAAEGEAGVQAAQFGQMGTMLGMEYGTMAGLQNAQQAAFGNQLSALGMQADMYGSQAGSFSNMAGTALTAVGSVMAAKMSFSCIAKGICIDTINGSVPIEDINVGDIVIGYNGNPTKVLQKHAYKEYPETAFYNIKIDYNNKIRTVDVGNLHRIMDVPAPDITENVISKEIYNGVEFSYDLLTEDLGYRIDSVPVNSMIEEMAELVVKLKNK